MNLSTAVGSVQAISRHLVEAINHLAKIMAGLL